MLENLVGTGDGGGLLRETSKICSLNFSKNWKKNLVKCKTLKFEKQLLKDYQIQNFLHHITI